jgi:transcriptional regulator with XRE-family HTH domain
MGSRFQADSEKIKELRLQRGWTQEQLAEIAGISARTIQRTEATGSAAFDTLRAMALAFELDFNQLLKQVKSAAVQTDIQPEAATEPPPSLPISHLPHTAWTGIPSGRRNWNSIYTAALSLAAGMALGGWFVYRAHFPAVSSLSHLEQGQQTSSSVAPAEKNMQKDDSYPSVEKRVSAGVRKPALQAAAGTPHKKALSHTPKEAETTLLSATIIVQPVPPTSIDVPAESPHLPLPVYSDSSPAFKIPSTLIALAPAEAEAAEGSQGSGAVRLALGEAGRKTGEFLAKVGASMKRAF